LELKKNISVIGVFSISTGAMISSGIFILPGLAFQRAGAGTFLSYLLAGVLALLGIFSIIELSTAMPKAGGDYFFINRTFGPLFGTLSGFLGWFALSLKTAFAIFGISKILYVYWNLPILPVSGFLCLVFLMVNLAGVKEAVTFQIYMVAGLLLILVIFVIKGLPQVSLPRFEGLTPGKINSIVITSGFIFISFGGLLKVANISEEVNNPTRNIPLGMISSLLVVTMLYTAIVFVLTGVLEPEKFRSTLTPVVDAAGITMGPYGSYGVVAASLLAFITTANAGLMAASRYPLALSRDNLIPLLWAQVTPKKKTPVLALSATTLLVFLSLLLPLETLVKVASTVILTSYVLTNLSVIIMRESDLSNYKPSFKAPFYPWLQIAGILLFGFFIIDLGVQAIEISLGFLFLCFCVYIFYGRKRNKNEYALLHLLRKIADRRLTEDLLENELRDILINRDSIAQDTFDQMLRGAQIRDIKGPIDFSQLLQRLKEPLGKLSGLDPEEAVKAFMDRQELSNTAISDFLALPHIVLEDDCPSFMYIIRCREGVSFSDTEPEVKAVFFLGGSKGKRVLHLKTIAALATLVGEPGFQELWMDTEKPRDIKDKMLLSKRRRYF